MDFVSNQAPQIKEMLKAIGVKDIAELFSVIPSHLKHPAPLSDDGLSEAEALQKIEAIANENKYLHYTSFLGGGAYEHHIPALVGAITSRSEFLTAYTPYQAEASQGLLQAIFEFQSVIAALTGLKIANASVYDGAAACAEAVLMALRSRKERKRVLIASTLHPSYAAVVQQYLQGLDTELVLIPWTGDGIIDPASVKNLMDEQTACVLVQSPNFFGLIEPLAEIANRAKEKEALFIVCGNPLAYGLFAPPAQYKADIAVGDCQPFGIPLEFGGPYAGYMACSEPFMRQMPGRIVGQTVDRDGTKGFVLTLQAREQHIRREKATSNICTNQALASLAALITILWYGPNGLKQLALTNYRRANYLRKELASIKGFKLFGKGVIFNEFAVQLPCSSEKAQEAFTQSGIIPGIPLKRYFPDLDRHLLIAVTETKSLSQINRFIDIARQL